MVGDDISDDICRHLSSPFIASDCFRDASGMLLGCLGDAWGMLGRVLRFNGLAVDFF